MTVGQDAPTVAGCRHADETSAEVSMSLGSQDAGLARTIIGPGSGRGQKSRLLDLFAYPSQFDEHRCRLLQIVPYER